ncbi:hypothetical protein MACK_002787 [Theileria orientalis]|uniref:Uncharacterized protein n=1 Tax=Theileria orientalis TaxID=68886 RepID=A0A976ME20_THEOR|nr:hypothetical protein MACK_002787 [Theileria orientalis]
MKYLITFLKILGVCVLAGIVDDSDHSSVGTPPPDFETYDISSDSRFSVVSCMRRTLDQLDYELCKRNPEVSINKVVDGEVVIWENNENLFRESSVIYDLGIPVALRIQERVTRNSNFYRRIEEGWLCVPEEEYVKVLKELKGSVPTKSTFGLNLRFHNENPKYVIEKITKKDANMYIFSPLRGHRIKFVYDNSNSIWKATEPSQNCISVVAYFKGEDPMLLHLFIADDNFRITNIFYKLVKGIWTEVTEEVYTDSIPDLKDNSERSIDTQLDLKTYNYKQFDLRSRTYENPFVKYIPKREFRVTRVSYGGELIWESKDPEIFVSSVDFFEEKGPMMARLNFNFQYPLFFKVFIKRSRGWEEGEDTDIHDRIYLLQTERNKVLEVSDVSPDVVCAMPLKMHTVDYLLLTSKKDCDIMAIRDGTQELWTYPGLDQYFSNGWIYYFPNRPKLLHFRIRDMYLGHEDYYFTWLNGLWEPISRHDYVESMNMIVYSSKKGLDYLEVPCSDSVKQSLEKRFEETSSEDERASERPVDPGFKEKLYSKYGSPDFDPTDDEDTLRLIATLHDEDFYDEAAVLSNSFEYIGFPYDLMSLKSSREGPQPRRRGAISFSHYDPRGFREPTDQHMTPSTPKTPYKSAEDIPTMEEEFDRLKLSRSKRYKSTSDIDKELESHGSYLPSDFRDSQSHTPMYTPHSWSSEEATPAPPPTPVGSPTFEKGTPPPSSKTPTPPSSQYGSCRSSSSSSSSSSLYLPSLADTPEQPRKRIRQEPPKEEEKKPSKPDFAFFPTISAVFLISVFSVIF